MATTDDFLVQAWKQQLDTGLRVIEALVEGATKLREMQLEAAARAHADLEATRKSIAAATDVTRLLELQTEWARANAQRCAEYWRGLYDVAARTQADIAGSVVPRVPAAASAAPADASKQAVLNLLDQAYKQWLDATQQFYRVPTMPMPAAAKPEKRASA
jgi:phasin family protein